jgi:hypothetical protein
MGLTHTAKAPFAAFDEGLSGCNRRPLLTMAGLL